MFVTLFKIKISRFFFCITRFAKLTCCENFLSLPGIMVLFRVDIHNFIVEDVLGCLSVVTMTTERL